MARRTTSLRTGFFSAFVEVLILKRMNPIFLSLTFPIFRWGGLFESLATIVATTQRRPSEITQNHKEKQTEQVGGRGDRRKEGREGEREREIKRLNVLPRPAVKLLRGSAEIPHHASLLAERGP